VVLSAFSSSLEELSDVMSDRSKEQSRLRREANEALGV